MKRIVLKLFNAFGYKLIKINQSREGASIIPVDIQLEKDFLAIYEKCKDYTMTSVERMYSLFKAVEYVVKNNLEGSFVECGVWRGGSAMLMALTLQKFGDLGRQIYLYDTYEGMVEPTKKDVNYKGNSAELLLKKHNKNNSHSVWCYSPLEQVKKNLASTNYPLENIKFIKGRVEDTIPSLTPTNIAILRLDTDWYESTKHELQYLYPLLISGGVLIIDDYGHWRGARQAVDEYFQENKIYELLNRIDYTGRTLVKR